MSRSAEPRSSWRHVLPVALAALGFLGASAGVRALVPWPEEYGLRAKYEYFRDHKDEFDAVYIGSSRVFRSFDPLVIDAELEAQGIPMRSFNLGIGGMVSFEMDFLLKQVVALQPARLKWIFLEGGRWDPEAYFLGNTWSSRSIFWHDTDETRTVMHAIARSDAPLMRKVDLAWTHLRLFGMKATNMAQGKRIVLNLAGASEDPLKRALSPEELEKGRGFQALDELVNDEAKAWRETLVLDPNRFQISVAAVAAQNAQPIAFEHYDLEALSAQYETARSIGARLVFVLPPMNEGAPDRLRLHERGDIPDLVDFNSPERYPQFFQVDNRFDEQHLNREGARQLSRLFASEIAALVKRAR